MQVSKKVTGNHIVNLAKCEFWKIRSDNGSGGYRISSFSVGGVTVDVYFYKDRISGDLKAEEFLNFFEPVKDELVS